VVLVDVVELGDQGALFADLASQLLEGEGFAGFDPDLVGVGLAVGGEEVGAKGRGSRKFRKAGGPGISKRRNDHRTSGPKGCGAGDGC
jgi:hypothetical protein